MTGIDALEYFVLSPIRIRHDDAHARFELEKKMEAEKAEKEAVRSERDKKMKDELHAKELELNTRLADVAVKELELKNKKLELEIAKEMSKATK